MNGLLQNQTNYNNARTGSDITILGDVTMIEVAHDNLVMNTYNYDDFKTFGITTCTVDMVYF